MQRNCFLYRIKFGAVKLEEFLTIGNMLTMFYDLIFLPICKIIKFILL